MISLTLSKSIFSEADFFKVNVMRCAIWYHWFNLKNVKNTHEGALLLVKLQAKK